MLRASFVNMPGRRASDFTLPRVSHTWSGGPEVTWFKLQDAVSTDAFEEAATLVRLIDRQTDHGCGVRSERGVRCLDVGLFRRSELRDALETRFCRDAQQEPEHAVAFLAPQVDGGGRCREQWLTPRLHLSVLCPHRDERHCDITRGAGYDP